GPLQAPLEFFYGQGYTINIAIIAQQAADGLRDDAFYSFGPMIEFVQSRLLHPITHDYEYLFGSNAQRALEGHQLSHSLSYAWMGDHYVQGAGLGSSAPVELWIDFGFLGVILGGAVTGGLITLLSRWMTGRFGQVVITLMLVQGLWFS